MKLSHPSVTPIRWSWVILAAIALAITALCVTDTARGTDAYTFESLTVDATIDGQDLWLGPPDAGQAVVVLDASGNGTRVVRPQRTGVFDPPAFLTRTNGASFDWVWFTGAETNAIIQFEATGEYVAMFALGCDRNGDGVLTSAEGEIGPAFGAFDRKFRIQEANLGTAYEDGFNEGGGDGNSGNDWYRIQLRLNFTANDSEGAGSLYFMNLTDGNTAYQSASGLRNRPLGLSRLSPDARPARWNAVWLQLQSNGNSVPSADNLVPNLNGIRITEIIPAGTDAVLRWRGGVGPYQVQRRAGVDPAAWDNVGNPTTLMEAIVEMFGDTGFFRIAQP